MKYLIIILPFIMQNCGNPYLYSYAPELLSCSIEEVSEGGLIKCPGQEDVLIKHGSDGLDGLKGETGAQGDKGNTGESGAKGDKGDQGETGPQGEQGEIGPQGPQGEPGNSITLVVPCPGTANTVSHPEKLVCINNTTLFAVYDAGTPGLNRLVELIPFTNYRTTDGRNCFFKTTATCNLDY